MKTNRTILYSLAILLLQACNSTAQQNTGTEKVTDAGTATIKTAAGTTETFNYTCEGCAENLKDTKEFQQIIDLAAERVQKQVPLPQTFKPISLSLSLFKNDSAIHWQTGELLSNLLDVSADWTYKQKNNIGVESESTRFVGYSLYQGQLFDAINDIRLKELQIGADGETNRNLSIFNENGDPLLSLSLTKFKSLKVDYPEGNIKPNDLLVFTFEDGSKQQLAFGKLSSVNMGYIDLPAATVAQLGKAPLTRIEITGQTPFTGTVGHNRADYFMQLAKVYK